MADDCVAMDVNQLVLDYHQDVYRYAYRLTGSTADAEDLTQQVFLKAQQKLGQLRQAESVRSWLFAILRNYFLKECRRRQPVPAGNLKLDIDALPTTPPHESEIDQERLQEGLNLLPARYRVVLTMFYFEDLAYREIAERLELPMGTVMSRLARAKASLRDHLLAGTEHELPAAVGATS
jgi:RNA polymerase sigma-70 factor (ECF subfamily)